MPATHVPVDGGRSLKTARSLLVWGLAALAVSLLLIVTMRISTNPSPGEFAFEVMAWLREITTFIGSGLLVAAVVLRPRVEV